MERLGGARVPPRSPGYAAPDGLRSPRQHSSGNEAADSHHPQQQQRAPSSSSHDGKLPSRSGSGFTVGERRIASKAPGNGSTGWDGFIGLGGGSSVLAAHSGSSFLSRSRSLGRSRTTGGSLEGSEDDATQNATISRLVTSPRAHLTSYGSSQGSPYARNRAMSSPHDVQSSCAEDPYSAKSLLGPMPYETPVGASAASATAAAAAAVIAKGKRQEDEGLWHDVRMFEEVPRLDRWESIAHHLHNRQQQSPEQGTSSRVNGSLSASAILRLMDRIAPWQVPKESASIVATQLDRMVELVSFRSACIESPGLLEELERHQARCFAVEQRQAEQKQVAERMKKMLAKKPKSAAGRNGGLASQRVRLQQAKEAAAMLDGPGTADAGASSSKVVAAEAAPRARFKHNVNAGVLFAEGHLASAGSPTRSAASQQQRRRSQSASKSRTHTSPRRRPSSGSASPSSGSGSGGPSRVASAKQRTWAAGGGGGGNGKTIVGPDHGVIPAGATPRKGSARDAGREPPHFSYKGYSYATANIHTLAGCGSVAMQKRVQHVFKQQMDTVKTEKKRSGGG